MMANVQLGPLGTILVSILRQKIWAAIALPVLVFSDPVHAQDTEGETQKSREPGIRLETFGNQGTDLSSFSEEKGANEAPKGSNLSFVPVPILNPTLKTGLGGAAILSFGKSGRRSTLFAGGGKTKNGTWLAGVGGSLHIVDDRFRIQFAGGGGDLRLKYYGVGPDSILANNPVNFSGQGWVAQIQPEIRVSKSLYVGVLARYMDAKIVTELPIEVLPDLSVPFKIVSAGPVIEYDSRDQPNWPTSGVYVSSEYLFAKETLGIFRKNLNKSFNMFDLSGSAYFSLKDNLVLAVNARVASADSNAPFFLKPSVSIRGFSVGEVLNDNIMQAQAELRWMTSEKFGFVVFGGVGTTSDSFASIGESSSSYGAGVRYRFSQVDKSNVGFDVARARSGWAVYFTVGEAF